VYLTLSWVGFSQHVTIFTICEEAVGLEEAEKYVKIKPRTENKF
jgi:hypothetical protein